MSVDRPRAGRPARRDRVELAIYEQAATLFAERGFAGTTPQDIADAVGISRQSLYYYVQSKDEILRRLVAELSGALVTGLEHAAATATAEPVPRLRALVEYLAADRALNKTRFRLLERSEAALDPESAAEYLRARRAVLAIFTSCIDDGYRGGVFASADTRVSALSIIGMCNWVAWWFEPGPDHSVEALAAQLADNAVAMLARVDASVPVGRNPVAVIEGMRRDLAWLRDLQGDPKP